MLIVQTNRWSREMIVQYIRVSMGVAELAAFVLIPFVAGILVGRKFR